MNHLQSHQVNSALALYGDESTSRELITYCLLAVPANVNHVLEMQVAQLYRRYGGANDPRFHCREIFAKDARTKAGSPWRHLNERGTWCLARDLALTCRIARVSASVGIVHKSTYPETMPDGSGGQFKIKNELCYSFGFNAALAGLSASGIIYSGLPCALFIDQQNTSFNMFGLKTVKLAEMIAATGLTPEKVEFEPLLLDLADLIAYCSARAFSKYEYRNKLICKEVIRLTAPAQTSWWWPPGTALENGEAAHPVEFLRDAIDPI